MKRLRHVLLIVALLPALLAGCAAAEPAVELRGQVFKVELALTRGEQARGLMFREELPPDRGMLFIFQREDWRSFWMKNTRIPLDILYFDDGLTLVSVAENARPCVADPCPSYPSEAPARYVLELNAGMVRSLGVEKGDRLVLLFDP
ncbi:MAG: DUF192 domain-containing protein [Gammaproteobacteria bacterium]